MFTPIWRYVFIRDQVRQNDGQTREPLIVAKMIAEFVPVVVPVIAPVIAPVPVSGTLQSRPEHRKPRHLPLITHHSSLVTSH
jgi:hypothetical protein